MLPNVGHKDLHDGPMIPLGLSGDAFERIDPAYTGFNVLFPVIPARFRKLVDSFSESFRDLPFAGDVQGPPSEVQPEKKHGTSDCLRQSPAILVDQLQEIFWRYVVYIKIVREVTA